MRQFLLLATADLMYMAFSRDETKELCVVCGTLPPSPLCVPLHGKEYKKTEQLQKQRCVVVFTLMIRVLCG
jgi:hypothetical protein